MALRPINVTREWHAGAGDCPMGLFCLGDAMEKLEALQAAGDDPFVKTRERSSWCTWTRPS